MSVITITSSARATDLPSDGWLPCCGQLPEVFTWTRGMGKGMIGVRCRRVGCVNHQGILDYERDAKSRWERTMAEQVPSIGRVVHYVYGDKHVPAIITDPEVDGILEGNDRSVVLPGIQQALTVFPVGEAPFTIVAHQDQRCMPATWHWPEYVPAKS